MEHDLTRGNVPAVLTRFALPLFFANLLQSFYNIVDMAVVGRYVGGTGLAGVGSAAMLCYVITAVCSGIATGGGVLVAQCKGAGDEKNQRETVGALFVLSIGAAALMTMVSLAVYGPVLRLMRVPEDAMGPALSYMSVMCAGTVFVLGYNAVCAVLRGLGDSKSPLVFVVVASVVNVVLDLVLVGPLEMGTAGAALATVASQALSFLAALGWLWRGGFFRSFRRSDFYPRARICRGILCIGLPTAVQLSVVNFSYLLATGMFNVFGTASAAAAGVGLKINTLAAMPCWAVGSAVTAMAGQNMGAGDPDRAADTCKAGLKLAMLASAVTAGLVFVFAGAIAAFFDPDPVVAEAGAQYLRICCSINCVVYAAMYVYDSFATGVGSAGLAMANALLHSVVVRLALSWFLAFKLEMGFDGLCLAEMLAPFPCAAVGLWYFRSGRWRRKEQLWRGSEIK